VVGEKGALFSPDDYGGNWSLHDHSGGVLEKLPEDKLTYPRTQGHEQEFYGACQAGTPEKCFSNFPDYSGPLTETILLGNLAVWAASAGGAGGLGEWGEKIEWDAKNLVVTNLASLKTPGVAELVKPKYRGEHKLD
jgi:hypothetical protein